MPALLSIAPMPVGAAPMRVRYYYTPTDAVRYGYYYEVLEAALKTTVPSYGSFIIERELAPVSSRRWNAEAILGERINVMWSNTGHPDLNEGMIPIPVPADRGVHGYRVLIIRAERQADFDKVHGLRDLQRFTDGQGENWGDVAILRHNGIRTLTSPTYDLLFPMLKAGRFDCFSRSVLEAPAELAAFGARYPGLVVERRLLLHYTFPVMFFVTRREPRLAERLHAGMQAMADNGLLKRIFERHFSQSLAGLKLGTRKIIELENPGLPSWLPFSKTDWWFDPLKGRPGR